MNHSPFTPRAIAPRFLDPNESLLVMCESDELDLDGVRLALDGLAHLCECAAGMNMQLLKNGCNGQFIELPADSLAALMRILSSQIKPAIDNPTLGRLLEARPDLCPGQTGGV